MSWVAVAIGGAAVLNYFGSQNAASNAADAQQNAANTASQTQLQMFNQQRQDQAPWRNAGANSVGFLSYLMGVPGYEKWSPGGSPGAQAPMTYSPSILHDIGNHIGGGAPHPPGGSTPDGSPLVQMRRPMGYPYKLQVYHSPFQPEFQQLPSGAHFLGPDGVERVKH